MHPLNKTNPVDSELEIGSDITVTERGRRIGVCLKQNTLVSDRAFDLIYPTEIAKLSNIYWTPVHVAVQSAKFFSEGFARRVLDVGSGCGKFCAVASIISPCLYTGVDQSADLTAIAKQSVIDLKATGCEFINGNVFDMDWSKYSGFYFFNPFDTDRESCIDRTRARLRRLPIGVRVVTYFGFGGAMPNEFKLVDRQSIRGDYLEFWIKSL